MQLEAAVAAGQFTLRKSTSNADATSNRRPNTKESLPHKNSYTKSTSLKLNDVLHEE
jgi:hypothetical protein